MTLGNQDHAIKGGARRSQNPDSGSSLSEDDVPFLLASASPSTLASHAPQPSIANPRSPRHWFKNATRPFTWLPSPGTNAAAALPRANQVLAHVVSLKTVLAATIALYALNQMALLPAPLSSVVSKVLFWPTLPVTVLRRVGRWTTVIDDVVVMGGAPFGFAGLPRRLHDEYGVRGVINLCEEYRGPIQQYKDLGMTQLWLPSLDHFCPSVETLEAAVQFVRKHQQAGERVYVHCRAGHGRSAAAVYCWLLSQRPNSDRKALNDQFRSLRGVKSGLWKEPAIVEFHNRLLQNFTSTSSATEKECVAASGGTEL